MTIRNINIQKIIWSLIAVIFSYSIYINKPEFAQKLLGDIEDLKFSVRNSIKQPEKNDSVVVVAIDEPSVNKMGRWPWDRKVIADLLSKLNQASVVGLDIVFSEKSNSESDQYFIDSIEKNENIILGYFLRQKATEETSENTWSQLENYAYHSYKTKTKDIRVDDWLYAEVNLPEISEVALSGGFFSTKPDTDGIYRHYPLAYLHKGLVLPPLAVQMLRYYWDENAELTFGDKGIESFILGDVIVKNSSHIRLNFDNQINEVSAYDIYSGKIKPEFFKDKIVLVGATEIGIFDLRPIPIDPVAPGVYQHYTAVKNLLTNNFIEGNQLIDLFLIGIVLFIVLIASLLKNYHVRLSIYASYIILVILVSYTTFILFNVWLHEAYYLFAILLSIILYESEAFMRTENDARHVKKAFSSYVSKELVGELIKDPDKLKLGGDEKEITTLFTDVRNFTTISESLTPTRLVSLLNRMFDPFTKIVLSNKGMLDKYIGDAMMVIFNAPLDVDNHAERACMSALEMISKQQKISEELKSENFPEVNIGIGINTGLAIVGNMGSTVRFGYTAIGDSVNLAARLEGLNKGYGTEIIISEFTKNRLPEHTKIKTRMLDKIRVKGKIEPVTIYEIFDNADIKNKFAGTFESALNKYFVSDFNIAKKEFEVIATEYLDKASEVFVERCEYYLMNPPSDDWGGIHDMKTK